MLHLLTSALLASALLVNEAAGMGKFAQRFRQPQTRASELVAEIQRPKLEDRSTKFRYLTNDTKPFQVTSMPEVNYNLGEMYAGSVPINKGNTSRELFFIFAPKLGTPVDEVTIWLNGGPGCSSMDGFFQENGRFLWQAGTYLPTENPYSWVNLTNMLWVDQPVGTGYSVGTPVATRQEETAAEFVKWFKNWQEVFGIKNYKIYVTGESYAGRYVPYISSAMLDQNDTEYYNLSGALAYDPCIGNFDYVQEEIPTVPFVKANANLFNFNASFMATLESLHESCGYAAYIDKYLTFPPSGVQPPHLFNYTSDAHCDLLTLVDNVALDINPCFNIYEVNAMCPLLWDVLGFPTQLFYSDGYPSGAYFNRTDVKKALHAPLDIDWSVCSLEAVYVGGDGGPEMEGDLAADPIQKVLPHVIEKTNRVLIGNGDYDMIIITNGTLMAIQNMTWNGQLGFQTMPSTPINIQIPDLVYQALFNNPENEVEGDDGPQGIMGIQHYERGLMWVESFQSGHMQPEFQPRVAYRHLEWLLGRIETI